MKKYLIFMLLLLVSVGVKAADVTTVELTFDGRELNEGSTEWYHRDVTDASQIRVGDIVLVSYDKVTSKGCQYAICDKEGKKIYTNGADEKWQCYDCPVGDTDFTFPIDADLYKKIVTDGRGLQIQDKGLAGSMTIKIIRMSENWNQYKPANATVIMSTPQYIKDWYNDGYVLNIGNETNYVGKTLRVVCLETGDDSYAFLKKNTSGWPSLMSGSDKFSIAGWKYFEIKINDELNTLLKGDGLRIGGNNYYIAGIYVYGSDTEAPEWKDEASDVIDTYTFQSALDGTNDWNNATIPAGFFEFKGQDDQISTTKLANTRNNVIRFVFDGTAGDGAQVSAKDVDGDKNAASYIRQRNEEKNDQGYGTGNFYYVNYADVKNGDDHFDFELSDAITVFKVRNDDGTDNDKVWKTPVTGTEGVKKGMLSTLLQNGMQIGANKVKIKEVQIRKSMVSKYVSGFAVYEHNLSNSVWRPIAFPYNLTQEQVRNAFGEGTKICELGPSKVTKEVKETGKVSNYYTISLSFQEVTGDINADYPYIIKVGNVLSDNLYKIEEVKADVRDFQAYEFRTGRFNIDDLNATMPAEGSDGYDKKKEIYDFEQKIKGKLTDNVYMVFQSTAPVFNITNTSVGNVEIISGGKDSRTPLTTPGQNPSYYNYYFFDGALWPVLTTERSMASGMAYIKFPAATKNLFDDAETETEEQASSKLVCLFPDDNSTTGIGDVAAPVKKQMPVAIYNLAGQLVRKGASMEGLAKGIYVLNGKKMIIK